MHIWICIYMYICKYYWLILHNATCLCVSIADHLTLDNQLECSFLGKTTCPTHSFLQFSAVLCRAETSLACRSPVWQDHRCCLCSAHVCIVMWVRLYRCSVWHYQETQSYSKLPDPPPLTISLSFPRVPWGLRVEAFCRCIHWDWPQHLCILVGCGFLHSARHLWSLMECGFLHFAQHLFILMGCGFL